MRKCKLSISAILLLAVSYIAGGRQTLPPDSLFMHFCSRQQLDSAYNECSKEALKEKSDCKQALTDYLMAEWAYENSCFQLSEYYVNLVLSSKPDDMEIIADCLSRACILQQRKGNLEAAIEYAERCLDIDRDLGNPENISSSLNNIAGLYLTFGQSDIARQYIDEAIEVERPLGRDAYLAIRLGMASEIYLKLGLTCEALMYSDEAFHLDSLAGRNAKAAIRLCQRASAFSELGDDEAAGKDLRAAIPILKAANNLNSLSIAYAQVGEICLRSGRDREALDAFNKSIEYSTSIGNEYVEGRGRKGLWMLARKDSPSLALSQLERYNEIQARINTDKAAAELARFNVHYETLKKEHTIALQHQKLKWGTVCLVLLLVLMVVLFVAFLFYKRSSRLGEEKNAILIKEALERDRLLMLSRQNMEKELKEELAQLSSSAMPAVKLTAREIEIARLSAKGLLSKEIAARFNISQRTVETHKNNLYRKLGINNSAELVSYMHKAGLLS